MEPKYPGVVERYVNMGDCYDKEALWSLRQEIMDCMSGYKGCYQRAYRCLGAAAEIMEDQRSALLTEPLAQKLAKRAHGILIREVPRRKAERPGRVTLRFLGAVTHQGPVSTDLCSDRHLRPGSRAAHPSAGRGDRQRL